MKTTMKLGVSKLECDLDNPMADRRFKDDWRYLPIWEAGSEFIVAERTSDGHDDSSYVTITKIGSWRELGPSHGLAFAALADALVPCEAVSDDAFFQQVIGGGRTGGFARWLIESKRLSRELFSQLWQAYMDNGQGPASDPVVPGTPLILDPGNATAPKDQDSLLARATRLTQTVWSMDHRHATAMLADLVHELAMRGDPCSASTTVEHAKPTQITVMKVTAETITDEQIALLATDAAVSSQLFRDCEKALNGGRRRTPSEIRAGREACADAWNARHGGSK